MAVRPGSLSHSCQAPASVHHEVCAGHLGCDQMGSEEEHRAESNGWSGEGGSDADEKKTEVVGSCGQDGGDVHS